MKRIALLPEGSVSHEAVAYLFGDEPVELVYHKLISDVFLSTDQGKTDYSVIPIENTIEGSVSLHMDWLVNEVDIPMQVEWVYPSIQNLIGDRQEFLTEGKLDYTRIQKILSHPVAMSQCQQFIRKYAPQAELINVGSTTEAIGIVKATPDKGWAAVGTSLGASTHGLDILAKRVTDHDNNFTRFVLIGKEELKNFVRPVEQRKTSVLVTLPEDFAGALHQVLATFAWRRLNLSRIESRPTKKKLGNYYFYIDVLESVDSVLLTAAIAEIEALGCQVRVLGSYPSFTYHDQDQEHNSEVQ